MTTREKAELFLKSKGWNNDPSVWGDLYNAVINLLVEFKNEKSTPLKIVGVLCFDDEDFRSWAKKNGHDQQKTFGTKIKLLTDDILYIGISSVANMVSYDFDQITETFYAINNPEYDEICNMVISIFGGRIEKCKYCKRLAMGIYSDEYVCEYHWNKFNDEFDDEYR